MRRLVGFGTVFVAGALAGEMLRTTLFRAGGLAPISSADDGAGLGGAVRGDAVAAEDGASPRGRDAKRPREIPLRGWKDIVLRTMGEFGDDEIPLIAAGCTFYALLALFPAITAFAALYGLFAEVGEARAHIDAMSGVLPAGVISLIGDQMVKVAAAGGGGLSFAFVIGLATALWSANKAMKAVITGLNIAYEETETRSFVAKIAVPLAFTVGFILAAVAAMALGAVGAWVSSRFGPEIAGLYTAIYWLTLFLGVAFGMALLYRFGPSRNRARWRWVSWGSGLAATAWLAMSGAFTFYVANFASYDESYGALGAVIGFMTWTWLSTMVFLMGAELNSEIEHQTARDTTIGATKPMGARGAVVADTLGRAA